MKAPEAVVPHNGTETVNNESKRDSAKLSITCSSIVTKVQNGGVTRHSRGLYKIILIRLMIIISQGNDEYLLMFYYIYHLSS